MTLDQSSAAQAAQQAERLRQVSQSLDAGVSQLQEMYAQIKGQWYGPASEAFCKSLDQLIQQMQDTNGKLMETAASMETAQSTSQ